MASLFAEQLIRQYRIGVLHVKAFAEDFTDAEAREAPPGQFPLVWFLSHLLCAHDHFLKLYALGYQGLDDDFIARWAGVYDVNADFSTALPLADLRGQYNAITDRVCALLCELTPEDLLRRTQVEQAHPFFAQLFGGLSIISFHDGYHAGQMAHLRTGLGKADLSEVVDLSSITSMTPSS